MHTTTACKRASELREPASALLRERRSLNSTETHTSDSPTLLFENTCERGAADGWRNRKTPDMPEEPCGEHKEATSACWHEDTMQASHEKSLPDAMSVCVCGLHPLKLDLATGASGGWAAGMLFRLASRCEIPHQAWGTGSGGGRKATVETAHAGWCLFDP